MRIAVFLPNLIGDSVMATPALRSLRRGFPDAELIGVMRAGILPVLSGSPWLDRSILYRPRSTCASERFWGVIRSLRDQPVDVGVLFPNSFRSALMARLAGCHRIVGFARGGRAMLLTDRLQARRDGQREFVPTPAVESYLAIVKEIGCRVDSPRLELFTTQIEDAQAEKVWSRLSLSGEACVVALNTGGAFGPAKNWPLEYFARLASRLAREANVRVLVLCGPAERDNAAEIVRLADHPSVSSLANESISIGLTKACLRRCALLVTTDSGPRHIATAFGLPVLTLFGPTHIAWTRTYHSRALHLQVPVPCGPCQRPHCVPGHHRCMRELQPDTVYAAALRLLGNSKRNQQWRADSSAADAPLPFNDPDWIARSDSRNLDPRS
jgi:lipopolysaccharide heptosyltransferase II